VRPTYRLIFSVFLLTLFTVPVFAQADEDYLWALRSISGNWATEGYGAVVYIDACESDVEELCGWLIWAWEPDKLKSKSIGNLMFKGATFDGKKWTNGKLVNPEDGNTYRGTMRQITSDRLLLKGCTAAIFCKTQSWLRLEALPHVKGLQPYGK